MSESSGTEGYKGQALEFLQNKGARVGQQVVVVDSEGLEVKGLIIPRYEYADDEHVVLKLKSGYNVGLRVDKIKTLKSLGNDRQGSRTPGAKKIEARINGESKKKLLLVSTGGTIASRVDYRTGAVYPALSASDLYEAVPELDQIAIVEPEVAFSIYSENMTPSDWGTLSSKIIDLSKSKKPAGVVVMMGTDTLGYTAAALSFSLIGFEIPVVIVGAQRSPDRPSSDAAINLTAAALFALESGRPGVYAAMHQDENDNSVAIHSGVRVRKNHTSRRDAFKSIDSLPIAIVKDNEITWTNNSGAVQPDPISEEFRLKTKFDSGASLVKFHPGFDPGILDYLVETKNVRGIIVEGTGLGHVSDRTVSKISALVKKGIFVGMTSQCIWGHVDLNVYETGRDLVAAGVIPLENMFAETAFAKLSWVLGNFRSTTEIMQKNFIGEFSLRILLKQKEIHAEM